MVAIETVGPTTPKLFTIWLFTQEVCPALKQILISYSSDLKTVFLESSDTGMGS